MSNDKNEQIHAHPLTAETVPVFIGRVESTGTHTSDVRLPQAHVTVRVQREPGNDGPALTYRRKLRVVCDEQGNIAKVHDERGRDVNLADFGAFETQDPRTLVLDVISEQTPPL